MLHLEFKKPLPDEVPIDLPVYSTEPPNTSHDFLKTLARHIHNEKEFEKAEVERDFDWNIVKSGDKLVAVNLSSGAVRFHTETKLTPGRIPDHNISERRLEEIAHQFVRGTKILEPEEAQSRMLHISYVRGQGYSTQEGVQPQKILEAGVIFGRKIENFDVFGLGGYLKINISNDESVIRGIKVWRHISEKVSVEKILKPQYAIEELEKRLVARNLAGRINVIRADFCYFEAGEHDVQQFLEPTYAFVFESRNGSFNYKSFEVIPAISNPKQSWDELGKRPTPHKPTAANRRS